MENLEINAANYGDEMILPDDFTIGDDTYMTDDAVPEADYPTTETQQAETNTEADVAPQNQNQTTISDATEIEAGNPYRIKVQYNHEEREITEDEAVPLIQKGMNYSKLEEKINALESNRAKSEFLAKQLGYNSTEEMIEAAENNFYERKVRTLMEDGNTEAMARFLVEQERAKAAPVVQPAAVTPQAQPNAKQENGPSIPPEKLAELKEFAKAYPGVVKLPDEVIKANQNGVRLLTAYEMYQKSAALDKAQSELAILRQNQASAERAPVRGSVGRAPMAGMTPDDDPFVRGFDSDSY